MKDKEKHETPPGPLTSDGVSRRSFLKGTGMAAMGIAASLPEAKAEESAVVGPGAVSLSLSINGTDTAVHIAPNTTLADTLRNHLGLTGTKISCHRGACSACTVWLDGKAVCSCMTLAIDVGTRKVTTIEGLADGEALHPVQQAFIDKDASMCGFCTPGMIMSCAALLECNAAPSLDDVRTAVSGNLCRCGTYPKVFEATLAAAAARGASSYE